MNLGNSFKNEYIKDQQENNLKLFLKKLKYVLKNKITMQRGRDRSREECLGAKELGAVLIFFFMRSNIIHHY